MNRESVVDLNPGEGVQNLHFTAEIFREDIHRVVAIIPE
jgi:hypothetical protein